MYLLSGASLQALEPDITHAHKNFLQKSANAIFVDFWPVLPFRGGRILYG